MLLKNTLLIISPCLIVGLTLYFSLGFKNKNFYQAKLKMSLNQATNKWGKPALQESFNRHDLYSWHGTDNTVITLWFRQGLSETQAISLSKANSFFTDEEKWTYIENITDINKLNWAQNNTVNSDEIIYSHDDTEVFFSKRHNGILIKNALFKPEM